jgi:hypothetical protein
VRSYIFVDNSNIFIEGQRAAASAEGLPSRGKLYRLDFGRLFAFLNPSPDGAFFGLAGEQFPKLYGSEPPPLDSIWKVLEAMGVGLKIFKKNPRGIEKRVDAALIIDCTKLVSKWQPKPDGEIVIVAGDADYYDLVGDALSAGWPVRVVCWRDATAQIVRDLPVYQDLTPHLRTVGFFEKYEFENPYGQIDWSKEVLYREPERKRPTGKLLPKGRVR